MSRVRIASPALNELSINFVTIFSNEMKSDFKHIKTMFEVAFKGESGIRTHGNRKVSSDFKSDAFDQLCHLS
jgi:hypothetical protein